MKIIQVLGSSAGGVSQHVAQVVSLLATSEDFQVAVAGPEALRSKFESRAPFQAANITDRPTIKDFSTIHRLSQLTRAADCVHAHGLRAAAMTVLAHCFTRRSKRPRIVVTLHNLPVGSWKIQAVTKVLEKVVAWGADCVLGVSLDIVERMRSTGAVCEGRALVPAPQLAEVSRGRDDVRTELLGTADAGTALIVTIARLAPQKGLDTVVRASSALRGQGVKHRWVVAGDGPLRDELVQLNTALGACVDFVGRRTDIPDLLAATDVVVNAAVWEGQPVAVQEALRAGCALVLTDVGGTREVAEDAALYIEPSDPPAMANKVTQVLGDSTLREALQQRAVKRSNELPTEEEVLESLKGIYQA